MGYLLTMKWFYALVVFVILLPGTQAYGQESGSGIELESALQSAQVSQGILMSVTASIVKNNEVLNGREITRHLKMSAYIKQPDGSSFHKALFDNGLDGDATVGDGVYSCQFIADQTGDYNARVIAEGKGFSRVQEHNFSALASGRIAEVPAGGTKGHKEDIKSRTENKNEIKGQSGELTSRKSSWITFVIVNVIIAVFWIAGFMFLCLRVKRLGPVKGNSTVLEFRKFISSQAAEKITQLATDKDNKQESAAADSTMINELHAARLQFLKGLLEAPRKTGDELPALWLQIYKSFDEALKAGLKSNKTALDLSDILQAKVEEISSETPSEVLKENADLKVLVRDLEESIKTKEKELAEAFHRFESLESEYMVLYHEKQASQQQPDI